MTADGDTAASYVDAKASVLLHESRVLTHIVSMLDLLKECA